MGDGYEPNETDRAIDRLEAVIDDWETTSASRLEEIQSKVGGIGQAIDGIVSRLDHLADLMVKYPNPTLAEVVAWETEVRSIRASIRRENKR